MNPMATPSRRRGMTLVELMTAMAIGAVLLGVAVTMLARVIAANATAAEHLEGLAVLDRLGEQFRRDVHGAASAKLGDAAATPRSMCLIACDGSEVEYEIAPPGVRRTKTAVGQPTHRESYALPGMKVLSCESKDDANGEVSLRIGRLAHRIDGHDRISGEFTIDAFIAGPCAAPEAP